MSLQRADKVVVQMVDERAFLLDERGVEMLVLNEVGTMVWDALDGTREAGAIAASLIGSFSDVSLTDLTSDIESFLDELVDLGLVVDVTSG
jgi:hypothetical protein